MSMTVFADVPSTEPVKVGWAYPVRGSGFQPGPVHLVDTGKVGADQRGDPNLPVIDTLMAVAPYGSIGQITGTVYTDLGDVLADADGRVSWMYLACRHNSSAAYDAAGTVVGWDWAEDHTIRAYQRVRNRDRLVAEMRVPHGVFSYYYENQGTLTNCIVHHDEVVGDP